MAARGLAQAEIDRLAAEGRAQLLKERAAHAPEIVNIDSALSLGEPVPLLWGEQEYSVKPISYREGLRLQRYSLHFAEFARKPPQDEAGIDELDAFLADVLAFMHGLLRPKPSANPFADATPWEVGALLPFFSACLTKQGGQSRFRPRTVSPTTH